MNYIVVSTFALLAAYLFDVVSLRRIPRARPHVGILAAMLMGFATSMICLKEVPEGR